MLKPQDEIKKIMKLFNVTVHIKLWKKQSEKYQKSHKMIKDRLE